jgi:hypothetical protein
MIAKITNVFIPRCKTSLTTTQNFIVSYLIETLVVLEINSFNEF